MNDPMNDIDDRISAALRARTDQITHADLTPASPPTATAAAARGRRTTVRWAAPLLAAAAVIAVAVTTAVIATEPQATKHQPAGPVSSSQSSQARIQSQLAEQRRAREEAIQRLLAEQRRAREEAASRAQSAARAGSSAPGGAPLACLFADAAACRVPAGYVWYVPLWPFSNYAQASQWATVDGPAGHSPWHSDAAATALFFTNNYLGFRDLTVITSTTITADEAHIGVGYKDPNGVKRTSAVLHLVRYERVLGDKTAGWEVVGSDDTTFSLESPAYDSTVTSPVTMGGHITGTDENIHAWVRAATQSAPLADKCCLPAGGQNSVWRVTVTFTPRSGPITLVASTGGHLIEHERFAIQGVIARS